MRVERGINEAYLEETEFHAKRCRYRGEGGCCDPSQHEYVKQDERMWEKWRKAGCKGKKPVRQPETVECEKCEYADLSVGSFQGHANARVICRHREGTIPVPIKGRKKVYLDNVSPQQLETLIEEFDPDLEAFAISGSPNIADFTFLERFPKLKRVYIWWNNKAESLWDFAKTPDIEYLYLNWMKTTMDISSLANAKKLRYFNMCNVKSLKPLEGLPAIECLYVWGVEDEDIRPLITLPALKYLFCHPTAFNIEAYAMFEARRPDVDTDFWEGLDGGVTITKVAPGEPETQRYVSFVGKRQRGMVDCGDVQRIEKQMAKFRALKEKYAVEDFIPQPKKIRVESYKNILTFKYGGGGILFPYDDIGELRL